VAATPAWFTIAVLVFNTPLRLKLIVGAFFAAGLFFPAHALLAVAAVAPVGRLIGFALDLHTFRLTEAIVVAFLAGWLLRTRPDPPGPRFPAAAGWLAALGIVASISGQAWKLAQYPGELSNTARTLYQAYYIVPDRIGFGAGARILEGLALAATTVALFRGRPRLAVSIPAALTVGAVAAAITSLLLLEKIGLPQIIAESALSAPRLAALVADLNAAGSYFGMMLLVCLGLAARRKSQAAAWALGAATLGIALWLTGSRSAAAATAIAGAAALIYALTAGSSRAVRGGILAAVILAALMAGGVRAWTLRRDVSADFRKDFFATSMRMIAARPALGVGIGQYYDTSPLFLSRFLGFTYGSENAHNFFLQLIAELGLLGAAPLLALLALPVVRGARAMLVKPDDVRFIGCVAGLTVLLTTCLTGHPLLLDEVAFPFWILLGVTLAVAGTILARTTEDAGVAARGATPAVAAVMAAAVILIYAAGARRPMFPSDSIAVSGLLPWQTSADGERYRWTLDYAGLFVPRHAARVAIPVRLPIALAGITPVGVHVRTAGIDRAHTPVGTSWITLNLELSPLDTLQAYRRIDLKVDRTWQPAIYIPGSREIRSVGVQVGEVKVR
jgi:O-antigen ligase